MTNEEAANYIIQHCNADYPKGTTEWETAMNMAVDALKAQERDALREDHDVDLHKKICNELNTLYDHKNRDYGDSFHEMWLEERCAMVRIRLKDKLKRFERLTKTKEQHVHDESLRDTLADLANYAIMAIMEIDREKEDSI